MVVCLCKGVADRAIRRAIRAGARTVPAIGRACGAGTGCGSCRGFLACALRGCDRSDPLTAARPGPASPPVPHVLAAASHTHPGGAR